MKLILCRECRGIAVPDKPKPGTLHDMITSGAVCPCGECAVLYTGTKNEIATVGPCTVLAIIDTDWQSLLSEGAEHERLQVNVWTVPKDASTVLSMDEQEAHK